MNDLFRCTVVTAEASVLDLRVRAVSLPTGFGSIGVLANHAPMLCAVSRGVVRCTLEDGCFVRVRISDGVASVADNELTILCADASALS